MSKYTLWSKYKNILVGQNILDGQNILGGSGQFKESALADAISALLCQRLGQVEAK